MLNIILYIYYGIWLILFYLYIVIYLYYVYI